MNLIFYNFYYAQLLFGLKNILINIIFNVIFLKKTTLASYFKKFKFFYEDKQF